MMRRLGAEDQKIITLARSARARVGSAEGAAVRDETGRTYAAATVALPSLQLSALALAVAMAVSSGAGSLEAAALVSEADNRPTATSRWSGTSAPTRSSSWPGQTARFARPFTRSATQPGVNPR